MTKAAARIAAGQARMDEAFGNRWFPAFTPPWNRCTEETRRALEELGFSVLSTDGYVRRTPDYERRDTGRWSYNEAENLLLLEYDSPDEFEKTSDGWRVLAVKGCEDSNVLLVLRAAILASRNLPIVFYRVHCNKRAYGTNWQQRLDEQQRVEAEHGGK